ncbi:xanthine dehydrogenase family protein molybdopterin-binding subunit [Amycolatopsis sp. FDAARGOS 1241]|uniref:xanthine dehydrogenase family protein molybdopterin-binding subunit n=1 Tax=Amycolatopsis sp. FDAARGOS 1241 TaxID=2778070 RepID=UPI001950925C|nr:xanthine dehydrogenase family protein molybdopterin-binding subunit [Amycolatopsis sp. FDAARGOS 1241]QRP49402.1 xanthine dehydrogenase family protein molybdopterin-binding subunit [Amycolatopsis sp. FDAARGOS 1241]
MTSAIGKPVSRVDGPAKVTGAARYTAEIVVPDLAYAVLVGATVPSGRVVGFEPLGPTDGLLAVLTHENLGKIVGRPQLLPSLVGGPAPGASFFPMQDDQVHYFGQPVALVVADSHERAQHAAASLRVRYERTASTTTIDEGRDQAFEAERLFGGLMPGRTERGDVDAALADAEVRLDLQFRFAANHHNALEPTAATAVWDGDQVTIYDSTQGIRASQLTVSHLLGLPLANVRVIANFVGGGFGAKAMIWPHVTLSAMAARHVGRPVKLVLTRPQTYTSNGHREEQEQTVSLGATRDGRLTALDHRKLSITSPFDEWAEPATGVSSQLYKCPNFRGVHRMIRGNTLTPTFMRGPGESTASFALETAMDELAVELGVDPVELRLRNHTDVDDRGNPWSSDGLPECLRLGAEKFGWDATSRVPRSRRDGNWLIGTGMASAAYPVPLFMPTQRARARLYADGSAVVEAGTQEFGTGVLTAMTQVGADALGVPLADTRFHGGSTDLPNVSSAVGSAGAGMISAAVHDAATNLRRQLIELAVADEASPLHGADPADVEAVAGRMQLRGDTAKGEHYGDLMQRHRLSEVEALGSWTPPPLDTPHGLLTFGAQFAEVAVDPDLGLVRVRRLLGAFAPGRVLNPKLARSQLMGGILWGLGQALLEGNRMDPRYGRWGAGNLGEYLVPVNADAPDVQVEFVSVADDVANTLGVKGVGEVGQVGVAAAIGNAVFNATGRRVRELPISAELVMDPVDSWA